MQSGLHIVHLSRAKYILATVGQLLANLRAGRDMGYGIWRVAGGELKNRPGYGIWDTGYGWDSNLGPAVLKSGALTTAPQARLLLLLLRYSRFCLLYKAWQHARLRDVVLSGRLVQRVGVAFAWDLHDRQARSSSFRVGPCAAASSAWRSCCLVVLTTQTSFATHPYLIPTRSY